MGRMHRDRAELLQTVYGAHPNPLGSLGRGGYVPSVVTQPSFRTADSAVRVQTRRTGDFSSGGYSVQIGSDL